MEPEWTGDQKTCSIRKGATSVLSSAPARKRRRPAADRADPLVQWILQPGEESQTHLRSS